jgi:hypothetical protein
MEGKKLRGLIKFVTLILVSTYLFSCSSKSEPIFNNCEIDLLAQDDSIVPSQYNYFDFFCKGSNKSVAKLQYKELKEVYQNQFYNLDYADYLFKLLNQKIAINTENRYYFQLDDIIYEKYKNCDLNVFLSYYCEKNKNERYKLTKLLSQSELNTFSYLLFINGYFVSFDDYRGVYRITDKKNTFYSK